MAAYFNIILAIVFIWWYLFCCSKGTGEEKGLPYSSPGVLSTFYDIKDYYMDMMFVGII